MFPLDKVLSATICFLIAQVIPLTMQITLVVDVSQLLMSVAGIFLLPLQMQIVYLLRVILIQIKHCVILMEHLSKKDGTALMETQNGIEIINMEEICHSHMIMFGKKEKEVKNIYLLLRTTNLVLNL